MSEHDKQQRAEVIIAALTVGEAKTTYQHSPWFKQMIDQWARMMVETIDAFTTHASLMEVEFRERVQRMEREANPMLVVPTSEGAKRALKANRFD